MFLLTAMLGFGQLTLESDSLYKEFNPSTHNDDMVIHNSFIATNVPATVKWEIYDINVPSSWTNDIIICDWTTCHPITVDSMSNPVVNTKSKTLEIHFINDNNIGLGTAKLLLYDLADSVATYKIITFVADVKEGVGIKENFQNETSIFPNPATANIFLNYSGNEEIEKIKIYNIIGKKVKEINNVSEKNNINVSNFNKGMYIIKVFGTNEKLFYTESFVKK